MLPISRLLANIDTSGEYCWEWRGSVGSHGYGNFDYPGATGTAHRAAYLMLIGEIPEGMHVLHRCDNRRCVRPDHLFLGTHADNMADMARKARAVRGEAHPKARLTEDIVRQIRAATGTQREIAERFGLSQGYVSQIKNRRLWAHVT